MTSSPFCSAIDLPRRSVVRLLAWLGVESRAVRQRREQDEFNRQLVVALRAMAQADAAARIADGDDRASRSGNSGGNYREIKK